MAAAVDAWAQPAADVERRLTAAVREQPDSFDAQHALGAFYVQAGQIARAIPFLERARQIDPAHEANGYDLAVAYLETDRIDEARREVVRLLARRETGELLNLRGDVEARAGDFIAAAEPYQRAARLQPTEAHLFDWGDNLLNLRAYEPASEVFAASVRRHPESARLHVGLGIAQYSRGRYDDAVASFCRAADLAPADDRPYQFLGEMYGVTPDADGAVAARLARFLELRPESAPAHYYVAMNLWKGQRPGAAPDLARVEALLRRAHTLDAALPQPALQLGILLSDSKRWAEAVPILERAAALAPDSAQAHFRLAQAYRRTGQTERADAALALFEKLSTKK